LSLSSTVHTWWGRRRPGMGPSRTCQAYLDICLAFSLGGARLPLPKRMGFFRRQFPSRVIPPAPGSPRCGAGGRCCPAAEREAPRCRLLHPQWVECSPKSRQRCIRIHPSYCSARTNPSRRAQSAGPALCPNWGRLLERPSTRTGCFLLAALEQLISGPVNARREGTAPCRHRRAGP
jgi:hypothetical protein